MFTPVPLFSQAVLWVIVFFMATDKPLLNFVIDPELLKKVDDFRYKHRFPTRAAAIKWLLEAALKAGLRPEKE